MGLGLSYFFVSDPSLWVGSGPNHDCAKHCGKLIVSKKVQQDYGRQILSVGTLKPLNKRCDRAHLSPPIFPTVRFFGLVLAIALG